MIDREWLDMATEFKIDEPFVRIVRTKSGGWLVDNGGYWLSKGQWLPVTGEVFRDREAALAAYKDWKNQTDAG